ncbi:MAG: hypothetical protein H0W88_07885 [Parachlamydiaceae bacterium]|nr:hypothetical protein [Parachlamydiaceae bacterium]
MFSKISALNKPIEIPQKNFWNTLTPLNKTIAGVAIVILAALSLTISYLIFKKKKDLASLKVEKASAESLIKDPFIEEFKESAKSLIKERESLGYTNENFAAILQAKISTSLENKNETNILTTQELQYFKNYFHFAQKYDAILKKEFKEFIQFRNCTKNFPHETIREIFTLNKLMKEKVTNDKSRYGQIYSQFSLLISTLRFSCDLVLMSGGRMDKKYSHFPNIKKEKLKYETFLTQSLTEDLELLKFFDRAEFNYSIIVQNAVKEQYIQLSDVLNSEEEFTADDIRNSIAKKIGLVIKVYK